jgi:hypothetical protein
MSELFQCDHHEALGQEPQYAFHNIVRRLTRQKCFRECIVIVMIHFATAGATDPAEQLN